MANKKELVIVESPAKARTLSKILGSKYDLKASLGHIRDLPKSRLGVDTDNNFTPTYVIPRTKSKIARELREAAKKVSTIYLATDPDREGEAISWHLIQMIKSDKKKYRRVVFHEITKDAIEHAFKHTRSIDTQLVDAQQARRVMDRLVGYKLSPLLWRKIRRGLSAGRVQSVALKIIVDREREIEKFIPVEYWSIEAELTNKLKGNTKDGFRTILVGLINGKKFDINSQDEATAIKDELNKAIYTVLKVKTKKVTRQPTPPFITSTLQQEAWRRLRFSAKQTMTIAQQLYEGLTIGNEGSTGLITYMRTDSTRVARPAVVETREFINHKYGDKYLPAHARSFTRAVKGAQEAHEAIRPTRIHREPATIKKFLNTNQFKLYDLIWKRMVASQMAAAINDNTTVDIKAECPNSRTDYLFRTSSSVNKFLGFIVLYSEQKDQGDEEEKKFSLPHLEKDDELKLLKILPEQHFTQPPHRFTEATLIKMLEKWGIGRPSTYAPILSTIQEREYVTKTNGSLNPTELGMVVNNMVSQNFPDIISIEFTAHMEDELDEIANDKKDWIGVIKGFYPSFEKNLETATQKVEKIKLPDEVTDELCPEGHPMVVKVGRFGKFLACSHYPEHKYTKSYQVKTGVKCPKPDCGGDLVEKINKKKRTFYGCSNYPDCDFATNFKPLPQPCPECGSLLTVYRTKWQKCTKCDYKDKLIQE
ncbi:type I DNA topoisomerase [Chloroflexota bacterium]